MKHIRKTRKYKKKRSIRRKKNTMRGGNHATVKIEHFIERKNKDGPKEVLGVPLVIYMTWHSNNISDDMNQVIVKNREMTPEFDTYFYSDKDCYNFIKDNFEPDVLNAFKTLKPGAFKADLFRYCILYKKGGVYSDIKMELHLPLIDILKEYPKIFIGNIPDEPPNPTNQIWNGFMSSPPGNPVFKACIDEIVLNCKNKDYRANYLDITGPCLLFRMNNKFESSDFISSLPFYFVKGKYEVLFRDKLFIKQNDASKTKQKVLQRVPHYSTMWNDRDVYDNINWTGGANENVGFIVTRCVKKPEHNRLYQECYRTIRYFHPELKIIFIDDNSDKNVLKEIPMENVEIIQSEYPAAGEYLPYYYLLTRKLFKKAIILQDSMFINTTIPYNDITDYAFLYEYSNDSRKIYDLFENTKIPTELTQLYSNNNIKGCWGTCMIITYDFVNKLEDAVGITEWKYIINDRNKRMALESAMATACAYIKLKEEKYSLFGDINDMQVMKDPGNEKYTFDMYLTDKTRIKDKIIKVWNGR